MAQHTPTSREGTGFRGRQRGTPATDIPIQSEKLGEILEQKPTGSTGNGMKRHAALIEPSKFDRSQSKFSYQRGNHFTCFGIIARYKYGLSLPRRVRICPELCCRQVVEGFDEARANESLTDDLGREATSQSLWRNTERIRDINENLAVPLLKLLRDRLVRSEWYCEENNLSPMSLFNRNRAQEEPASFARDSSVSGPREFAIPTSTFLRAKMRASAVPIWPEPIMTYFIAMLQSLSACRVLIPMDFTSVGLRKQRNTWSGMPR